MPNFTFYEGRKQATTKFFLSLNLNAVPKKSTLEKFAFFRHFHRIRINAKKFEKTPIHFKSDVFAAVAVVDAKTPYSLKRVGWGWALIWVWFGGGGGGRLLTFSAFRMGAYSRWALIRGWALIRINTVSMWQNPVKLLTNFLSMYAGVHHLTNKLKSSISRLAKSWAFLKEYKKNKHGPMFKKNPWELPYFTI